MQHRLSIDDKDLTYLAGMFIIEMDNDDFRNSVLDKKGNIDGFWIEKRISFLAITKEERNQKYSLCGLYYPHSKEMKSEEMVEYINRDRDRHYRLLNPDEVKAIQEYKLNCINKYGDSEREK